MKQSEIQERKLHVIEKLITLDDERIFKEVEDLINSSIKRPRHKKLTKQELIGRAKASNDNIENSEVYSQEEAEKLSHNW